ncbi:hypothetical protein P7C71_g1551, partial [Lecanoromycetidae sp. Uapishka_2]
MSEYAKKNSDQVDLGARYASIAIRDQLKEIQQGIPALPTPLSRNELAPIVNSLPPPTTSEDDRTEPFKVGIIGAGVAGLFTAMILDYLNEHFKVNVEYEILECNKEERLGGRLYTHYFSEETDESHDYYDVGAMRYPDIGVMKQTFQLFDKLGMTKQCNAENAKKGDLIPYYLNGENTPLLYNDVQVITTLEPITIKAGKKIKKGPSASTFDVTGIEEWYQEAKPGTLVQEFIKPFVDKFAVPEAEKGDESAHKRYQKSGWNFLMKYGDAHTVRQWFQKLSDYNTTEWLETFSYGTSWYDEALTELVLEDINFSAKEKQWWCVLGGSQVIAKRMFQKLKNQNAIEWKKRVTKMERLVTTQEKKDGKDNITIRVTIQSKEGKEKPRDYDAVFNSAPLGAMQRMDLRGLNLNWGTKQAIRSLGYGASCKVGIKFKYRWWVEEESLSIIKGGSGKTDLPIRNCVYPSYNLTKADASTGETKKPGVLLCSYTWSQEAQRIGALIKKSADPESETELKALLIDNLARLHSKKPSEYDKLHKLIEEAYITHFAYDWYTDLGTTGAFAYFGPGQFRAMYPWIANRNDGNHIIVGEAASAHHAWVVGALESATRGVYQFLYAHSKNSTAIEKALDAYNNNKIPEPFGPLPAEFDRTRDVGEAGVEVDMKKAAAEGEWARQGVTFEQIRQAQGGDQLDLSKVTPADVAPLLEVKA